MLALLATLGATLTLPGIAGIVLTMGMAVDANVLINERIREELTLGKTPRAALEAGYERAWAAIRDSNVTTFVSGLILFQFGSGPVKGFAVTLCLGIVTTVFTAVFATRVYYDFRLARRSLAAISV
jgi:preprotein translocase subunit SecD